MRLLLNELNGLKYTGSLLTNAGGSIEERNDFLLSINKLRQKWFDSEDYVSLPEMLNLGINFISFINEKLYHLWKKHDVDLPSMFSFRSPSTSVDFVDRQKTLTHHIEKNEIVLHLQKQFSVPMLHYAALQGPLSEYLEKKLCVSPQLQKGLLGDLLTKRGNLLNEHFIFLLENNIKTGFFVPFHFGLKFW